jgi:aminocarboxymuconate-semialdehyde decarboxylase
MQIDMHAHVIPENFPAADGRHERWPVMDHFEPGKAKVMIGGENFRTADASSWDYDRRLEDMAAQKVDAQVVSPLPELTSYWFDAKDGLDICRYTNEAIAESCHKYPALFYGLGMVPLQDPDLAAKELSGIKSGGLAGIELGSNINGKSLGAPEFQAFFQEADRLQVPIFVHASRPTFNARISPRLGNSVGYPMDTGASIASMIDSGTAEMCPTLRIAFAHGGGTLPFMLPRMQHGWSFEWNEEPPSARRAANMDPARKAPVEYARRFYYDTLVFDARAIRFLAEIIGVSQLLVGTDYPYLPTEAPVGKTLNSLGLDAKAVEDIAWNNCFRFLGIEAPVMA